ncbi:hypothetical protein QEN19_003518 [Hanseniaspora menglaensis]
MSNQKQTVFLTGITGFIAQNIAKQLLDSKKFKVIGTARSEEKAKHVTEYFKNDDLTIVSVKELGDPTAFDEHFIKFGKDIDFIIHTASPFAAVAANDDIDEFFIKPAVNGATGIFKAAVKYAPNLKHFVITASFASMIDVTKDKDTTHVFNENSWNPVSHDVALSNDVMGYFYSKTLAEKAVWDLQKELDAKFNITAINPGLVLGPQVIDNAASASSLNFSCEFINNLLKTKPGEEVATDFDGLAVDVRDVARAHIEPLLNSEKFKDQRLILNTARFGNQLFLDILNSIPEVKGKIAVGHPGTEDNLESTRAVIDNKKTNELLGYNLISLKQSVEDTVNQIIKVKETKKKVDQLVKNLANTSDLSVVSIKNFADSKAFKATFDKYGLEINYINYAAAPYSWGVTDCEQGFIQPGINGSKNIFTSAFKQAPNLKHFFITSSFAAMLDASLLNNPSHVFNEESWNPITHEEALKSNRLAYRYSKTIAEKTVWNLKKELQPAFGVTSVIPNLILGPQCFDTTVSKNLNTSCEYVNKFIKSNPGDEVPVAPSGGVIDVRDLAKAHIEAIKDSEKFDGKRLFLTNEGYGNQTFVDILNEIEELKGKITIGTPHRDDDIDKRQAIVDNKKTRELLGFEFIPLNKTIKDLAMQVIKVESK